MIICYFDGACEPVNPGGTASWGAVAYRGRRTSRLWEGYGVYEPETPGATSNNVAEYRGFLAVLNWLSGNWEEWGEPATICGDSKLVVEQMLGRWRIKDGLYLPHAEEARSLLGMFSQKPAIQWVPRDQNGEADRLSKLALEEIGVRSTNWSIRKTRRRRP
jgi:ribonuclease HI